jgi:glucose-6-phosphate isomerase
LAIPSNVGGRFSLLSPVGLLPALLGGADVDELLDGAADMAKRCQSAELRRNPAGIVAATHVLQHRLRGRSIHVMMPYADRLRPFAAWYVQLWAESLGKRVNRHGQVVEQGPTPIAAVGATDQHAQMQLFMEGPRDKLITFLRVAEPARDLVIPHMRGASAYLGGASLHDLLEAEREGTTQALASDGRPSITISVQRLDAFALGALFFLYEAATAFAGELYDVHAFDQPGVELGKRLAYGLLGREGYERTAQEIRTLQAKRPKRYRVA